MIGREKLLSRLEKALATSKADETELVYFGNNAALTRFAESVIHQNVSEDGATVFCRCAFGRQVGIASTTSTTLADLKGVIRNAADIARLQPENPQFPGLPKPAKYRSLDRFDTKTARVTPKTMAGAVRDIIRPVTERGFKAAGAFSNHVMELAVANSRGVRAWHAGTSASVNVTAMAGRAAGRAEAHGWQLDHLDWTAAGERAAEKCAAGLDPVTIDPGEYEVILEPLAVSEVLIWFSLMGFNSKTMAEKTSIITGKLGKKIMSKSVSLQDNAYHPALTGIPFDFEGVPRRKLKLVEAGVPLEGAVDRARSRELGKRPTGHALPPNWSHFGAMPSHLVMAGGTSSREKMITSVKRGLLVTRLHYVRGNMGSGSDTLTGMTRDGTFLIENGRISRGVSNLRFTQPIISLLKSVKAISAEREVIGSDFGADSLLVPALHVKSFRFTGRSEE